LKIEGEIPLILGKNLKDENILMVMEDVPPNHQSGEIFQGKEAFEKFRIQMLLSISPTFPSPSP
jgi:hypothetical protein